MIANGGNIDAMATDGVRAKMREASVEPELFEIGRIIDEIKVRSLEEIHLSVPVASHA